MVKAMKHQSPVEEVRQVHDKISVPFPAGEHKQIAVKVIDPRGNELLVVKKLETKGKEH
jgi:adenine-specific DNA-methyltransferase